MLALGRAPVKKNKSYTPAPQAAPEQVQRLAMVQEVLAGKITVSEAARTLGLSRNHFQTLLHRASAAMIEAIGPKPPGRPTKSAEQSALEAELARLRRENARLQEQVGTTDRLLEVASGLLQGRIRPTGRSGRQRRTKGAPHEKKPDEPDAERRRVLQGADEMNRLGLTWTVAARIAGAHASTLRRWRARGRAKLPLARRASVQPAQIPAQAARQVSELVRSLNGLIGADSLRHSVEGLSRRQAAWLKAQTLCDMERERKASLTRVGVSTPDVMRGLDGMYLHGANGTLHALFTADAAIPYRTQVKTAARYDAQLVVRALRSDIENNGAPLVYRLDRASAHDAPPVRELLKEHQVLVLHGPPHCPRFYGQHERQNREHRAWEQLLAQVSLDAIQGCLEEMLEAVNKLWRRRTLGWKTAYEAWSVRRRLEVDRCELREEVSERAVLSNGNCSAAADPRILPSALPSSRRSNREVSCVSNSEAGARCFLVTKSRN